MSFLGVVHRQQNTDIPYHSYHKGDTQDSYFDFSHLFIPSIWVAPVGVDGRISMDFHRLFIRGTE